MKSSVVVAQLVKNLLSSAKDTRDVQSLGWEGPLEKGMTTHFQYSWLVNLIDRGAWQGIVHGVPKSWRQLSD